MNAVGDNRARADGAKSAEALGKNRRSFICCVIALGDAGTFLLRKSALNPQINGHVRIPAAKCTIVHYEPAGAP